VKGTRNEVLDCSVYALAAIRILRQHMGLSLKKPEPRNEPEKPPARPDHFARSKSGFERR